MFLEKLRVWSQQFPPAERDKPLQESLAPLGTTQAGASPYPAMPEAEVTTRSRLGSSRRRRRCIGHSVSDTVQR